MLFAGLNYELNAHFDLYFNLMYAWLDNALQSGAANIEFGQTADGLQGRAGLLQTAIVRLLEGSRTVELPQ